MSISPALMLLFPAQQYPVDTWGPASSFIHDDHMSPPERWATACVATKLPVCRVAKMGKGKSRERLEIHSTPTGKKILQSVLAEQISATGIFSLGDFFFSSPPHLS